MLLLVHSFSIKEKEIQLPLCFENSFLVLLLCHGCFCISGQIANLVLGLFQMIVKNFDFCDPFYSFEMCF
jgi:hypothetical protein